MRQQRVLGNLQCKRLPGDPWVRNLIVAVDLRSSRNDRLEFGEWWTDCLEVTTEPDGDADDSQDGDEQQILAVEVMHEDAGVVPLNDLEQTLLADHEVDQVNGEHEAADRDQVEPGLQERLDGRAALNIEAAILVNLLLNAHLNVRLPNSRDFRFRACQIFEGLLVRDIFVVAAEGLEKLAVELSDGLEAGKAAFLQFARVASFLARHPRENQSRDNLVENGQTD